MTGKCTPKDVLVKARKIVADPNTWTTGTFARTKDGTGTVSCSPDACQFCALGAIERVAGTGTDLSYHTQYILADAVYALYGHHSVPRVNDDWNGQANILKAFDRAIEKLEQEGR